MYIGPINLSEKPLFLAPMEDVSDAPFRQICREKGADIVYTEFISSEALIRDSDIAIHKMSYTESERPLGIQILEDVKKQCMVPQKLQKIIIQI